jgi:nicotinate-nucleotide adenylyltransferase
MGINSQTPAPVVVFGGSFDPVHQGHVDIARYFVERFVAQELRIIPAGQPWQKNGLIASAEQRCTMLALAFENLRSARLVIDQQEIRRATQHIASYSVDSLSALREEFGPETPIILVIGADQFHNLPSWKNWQTLFQLAHIVVAARPGYSVQIDQLDPALASIWLQASSTPEEMKKYSFGKTWIANDLAWDISATRIRDELQQQGQTRQTTSLIPRKVLDYIQAHDLYKY